MSGEKQYTQAELAELARQDREARERQRELQRCNTEEIANAAAAARSRFSGRGR